MTFLDLDPFAEITLLVEDDSEMRATQLAKELAERATTVGVWVGQTLIPAHRVQKVQLL